MRKMLILVAVAFSLALVGSTTAQAAVRSQSVRGIGSFYCNGLRTTAHHVYFSYCSVRDTSCDGHAVYLQVRTNVFDFTPWTKKVPGGCRTTAQFRRGSKWTWRTVTWGAVRICQDDWGWDTCGPSSRSFQR